jgi:hypothetical protein
MSFARFAFYTRIIRHGGLASRRPERTMEGLCVLKFSSAVCVFKRFIRRAGCPSFTAGILPAATEKRRRAAALQDLPDVSTAHRYARSVLEMRQSSGAVGTDGAHFRLDIAAKAFPTCGRPRKLAVPGF